MSENTRRADKPATGFYRVQHEEFYFSGHFNKNDEMRWVVKENPSISRGWKLVGSGTLSNVSSYSSFSHVATEARRILDSFVEDRKVRQQKEIESLSNELER